MVEETRRLLERSISSKNPRHTVAIGLTEAEAAAVYAGNEHYQVSHSKTSIQCYRNSFNFVSYA